MKTVAGSPFWPTRTAEPQYERLHASLECDVVVLGGGITGALATHALALAGFAVVTIDKRDIGDSSTGATTGLLQYETDLPLYQLMRKIGPARAVRSYQLNVEAVKKISRLAGKLSDHSDFVWRGSVYGATKPQHVAGLKREYEARRRHGIEVEYWDRRRVERESSLPFSAALVSPCAAEIDAYRFTHALLQSARIRGARIFVRTKVREWRSTPHGIVVCGPGGLTVTARWLIVATGYEAHPPVPRGRIRMDRTFAFVSEPVRSFDGWPGRRLVWETARPYLYCRTTPENRVLVGGGDIPFHDPVRRAHLLRTKVRHLREKFATYFPAIPLSVAQSWMGAFASSSDSLPFIGSSARQPNVIYTLGYGGNGITFSLLAAELIRDRCLGLPSPDAELFRLDR
jgi:glycine/D-amino acid oxidase-like deaminating enzyme